MKYIGKTISKMGLVMALWQCDFHLCPRGKIEMLVETVSAGTEDDDLVDRANWLDCEIDDVLIPELDRFFDNDTKSFYRNHKMWGDDTGNRVDLHFSDGKIETIGLRVDARKHDGTFVGKIATWAEMLGACLVSSDRTVVENDLNSILKVCEKEHESVLKFLADKGLVSR